ncbi:MAG TPA: ATP-binding cassette domain-containing protein [Caulobacteraceae bacterium]|jgi:cell division transport system ATP-binding protein
MSISPEPAPEDETGPWAQPVVRFDAVACGRDGQGPRLRGLSFAFGPGSFHLITGPAGSGKTTLLRVICLAEPPLAGVTQVFGRDVATLSRKQTLRLRRRLGVALQPAAFLDHLSVWDNAALVPRIVGRPRSDYAGEVDAVLKWLGLAKLADSLPADLSAAERHRLAIARALANRPEVVLVDEPDDLDEAARTRNLKHLREVHGAGATVVLATRDEAFARASGLPVLRLQDGRSSLLEPATP